jgi:hypothetical protein
MAILNMDNIFDKLHEYIDRKTDSVELNLKDLFDEYGVKEVLEALPQVNSVANNLVEIKDVAHNIYAVKTCYDDIQYIKAAPQAAQTAIEKAAEAADSATEADTHRGNAYLWSSAPEDVPVDDGVHQGYSAYHWAQKAGAVVNDPSDYYMRDGSLPITNDFAGGGFKITNIADGINVNDSATVGQVSNMVTDVEDELDAHRTNTNNPHSVTAAQVGALTPTGDGSGLTGITPSQVGADPAGSADAVQTNLDTHTADTGNPHSVTKAQVGLDFVIDTGDGNQYLANDGTYKYISTDGSIPELAKGEYIKAEDPSGTYQNVFGPGEDGGSYEDKLLIGSSSFTNVS